MANRPPFATLNHFAGDLGILRVQSLESHTSRGLVLDEVKKAATARFNALDRDHDGTIDRRELGATVTAWQFRRADPDKDRTLDKNEYLALVEKLFRAADKDHDGTLDRKELNSW